ncbi:unnamed protein product [Urochloa decumbens]|uniref:F-box/LRR-repeat protein 15/At3g58940/PEG3-like LRR domain-containing protein n=1 Tax=Urochloa decumbens TaxID=240449 RepID=A0ABC9C2R0_9POAL
MGEDQRRSCSGEDRISGLPDEMLQEILVRLRCSRAAARTGLLSRRWSHVWPHLPELVLYDDDPDTPPQASFMDAVDAAIGACLAPTLERLLISLSPVGDSPPVPAGRVALWLRFASQCVVGTLSLYAPSPKDDGEEVTLELPACKGAKKITLFLAKSWRLQLPPAGLFMALTSLSIRIGRMEGSELTALVCTQCPRLKSLNLSTMLVATFDFTIRSDSLLLVWLHRLKNTRRIEIVAPRLEELFLSYVTEARISAPKLAKFAWHCEYYDPYRHQFVDVGRRLKLLETGTRESILSSFMKQFDEVDELKLEFYMEIPSYESFLNGTNKLPKCKTLSVTLFCSDDHGLAPTLLHLLKSCNSTRTLSIVFMSSYDLMEFFCPLSCYCRSFEGNSGTDDISLNSLEEVKITSYASPHGELEFVEHLSRCHTPVLKRLVIKNMIKAAPLSNKETCEKILNMCRPSINVEFYASSTKGLVRIGLRSRTIPDFFLRKTGTD